MRIPSIPRPILVVYGIDAGLAIAWLVDRFLRHPFGSFFSDKFLDLDGERNLTTWYASQKLFLIGALLLWTAWSCRQQRVPRAWLLGILGAVFLGFSADEFIGLHEQFAFMIDRWLLPDGDRKETVFSQTGIWMFVLVIPALAALLWTVAALERLWSDRGVTALLGAGMILFLSGAFSDVLINFAASHRHRAIQIFVEELLEMAGATTILWGALRLLKLRGVPG
jgi:hypothetical protein